MRTLAATLGVRDYVAMVLMGAFALVGFVLAAVMLRLMATVNSLKESVDRHTNETVPLIQEVGNTVKGVNHEIERVDSIMASAQSVAHNVETISHTVKAAVTNPLVKALAFAAGARRATKKFKDDRS